MTSSAALQSSSYASTRPFGGASFNGCTVRVILPSYVGPGKVSLQHATCFAVLQVLNIWCILPSAHLEERNSRKLLVLVLQCGRIRVKSQGALLGKASTSVSIQFGVSNAQHAAEVMCIGDMGWTTHRVELASELARDIVDDRCYVLTATGQPDV